MDIKEGMKVEYENKVYTITKVHYEYLGTQPYWDDDTTVLKLSEHASWVRMVSKGKEVKHIYTFNLRKFKDFVELGIIKIIHTKKKNNYY